MEVSLTPFFAEIEYFFEQQLTKHRFDAGWARDVVFVHRQSTVTLSIAQWRYCVWAAVRHGGALAQQQHVPDLPTIREAIHSELRRRAGYVAGGQWDRCALPPFQRLPHSALGRLFVTKLVRKDLDFWSTTPELTSLAFNRAVGA